MIDIFQLQAKLSLEEYWKPYKGISIHQLSGEGNLVSSLSLADMFSPEGERLNIPLQLEPGLYCISIHFIDGSFLRIVGEKETESYNPNTMANNLNVIIYPVPIQENYFNMNLQATENLEFNYTLYDFNGNRIYNTKVFIKEGESASIDIKPEGGIPVGYLINVFHFSDDSQLSILTVKSAQ